MVDATKKIRHPPIDVCKIFFPKLLRARVYTTHSIFTLNSSLRRLLGYIAIFSVVTLLKTFIYSTSYKPYLGAISGRQQHTHHSSVR